MAILRPRERDVVIQSLRTGVVPRSGLQHIQVGRAAEIRSLISDIDRIADGGSAFRLVVGEYGAGKTFFMNLVRAIAQEKRLVTAHADLGPDRRIHGTNGQGRSLYSELIRNLATRARPDGGALSGVLEKFASGIADAAREGGISPEAALTAALRPMEEMVHGYTFNAVIRHYWEGHESGNETMTQSAERWLKGEFSTKTDARNALGVRTIIDDENVYDHLKLLARFTRVAGYAGLLVTLDELVNLYKLANSQARSSNYEEILRILNDSFQGTSEGIGFVLGGTPEFLTDPRRGLYSYQALASRLGENAFANKDFVDFSGPVLRLSNLSAEDLYVLLTRLRHVFAGGDESKYIVPDEALQAFMNHCSSRIGDAYFRTPRTTIRAFLDLLAILEQNPAASWTDLIDSTTVVADREGETMPDGLEAGEDDDLATLRL